MSLQLKLRQTTPNDYQETENVIREAFWNVYEPGCSDHYLVHIMRQSDTFIPELDIVATLNDKIIGNVVYSTAILKADNGEDYPVLALGPIGILPEYHRQHVGSKLIDFSHNIATKMDYRAIFLFGNPKFYRHEGFLPAEKLGIRTSENKYADAHHVCELYPGALKNLSGRYFENPIYDVDPEAVKKFDSNFPTKKQIVDTPSQLEFQKEITNQHPYQG